MSDAPAAGNAPPLVEIEGLTVGYRVGREWRRAVRRISLEIQPGQVYGVAGESGSGKTTLALALMRALPRGGRVLEGSIRFAGQDLLARSQSEMRRIWGAQMAFVPQEPLPSLNPSMTVEAQMTEPLRQHAGLTLTPGRARERVTEMLERVRIADPARVVRSYPHQLSGGMQQRVLLAMALSTRPRLLVLDEPTTSLDATTQGAILDLIAELIREDGASALYVSHNLGVLAQVTDRLAVMYAGELVEDGPTRDLYRGPLFPYTRGLLDSVPRLGENRAEIRLRPIPGRIPALDNLPGGCIFRPRCPIAVEVCFQDPPLYRPDATRRTRCHRWEAIRAGQVDPRQPAPEGPAPATSSGNGAVLAARGVEVHLPQRGSLLDALSGRRAPPVKAVDGVDLDVGRARTLGLVGESGSGKTTLARAVVGLAERTRGEMRLFDRPLPARLEARPQELLGQLQIVFQSPQEALNPYLTVGEALRYPFESMMGMSRGRAEAEVGKLLTAVHLPPAYARRLPSQLSGGEVQRVALARAVACSPALVVADEPVTSLDVSVQASILNLLNELQAEKEIAYLFISHDLAVVGYLADVVAVIYLGRLMEVAASGDLLEPPHHPYTEALLSAIPLLDPDAVSETLRLEEEVPSPANAPGGCPFHTRCPRFLGEICAREEPPWRVTASGKRYYCHIPPDELLEAQGPASGFADGRAP